MVKNQLKLLIAAATLLGSTAQAQTVGTYIDSTTSTTQRAQGVEVTGGGTPSGATDVGSPVKIGGRYNVTPPTLTDGQRGDAQLDTRGNLNVTLRAANSTNGLAYTALGADGQTTLGALALWCQTGVYNGSTWDRARGNVDTAALVTHTAASAGVNSADQVNYNARGVKVVVNVTAITGTAPTLTVAIQGKDNASGVYYTLLSSAAISATGTTVLEVYPGVTAAANASASTTLPRTWRISTAIGGTTPAVTATVGASVIL